MIFVGILNINLNLITFEENVMPDVPYGLYVLEETLDQILICVDGSIVNEYMKVEVRIP